MCAEGKREGKGSELRLEGEETELEQMEQFSKIINNH